MTVATRCMNKNSIWITVFGQNCLQIFTSYFCLSLSLSPLSVYSFSPTETPFSSSPAPHLPLSLPAVPPLGLMNDLAGDGSCGCGEASGARRGEETLFLSPPSDYSHSPGYSATEPCQEQDGTGLLDYLLELLPGPGQGLHTALKQTGFFNRICLSQCQHITSKAIQVGRKGNRCSPSP